MVLRPACQSKQLLYSDRISFYADRNTFCADRSNFMPVEAMDHLEHSSQDIQ